MKNNLPRLRFIRLHALLGIFFVFSSLSLFAPFRLWSQAGQGFAGFEFQPPKTGPYEAVPGKFFIRTYLVYVEAAPYPTWATDLGPAELKRRSGRTLEMLNAAFNQFDIYFVAASGQEYGCYAIKSAESAYEDGLTIHIYHDDNEIAQGGINGNTLPVDSCWVKGNENGIPASNTTVLIHEVGHCLGLPHTHEEDNPDFCVGGACIGDPLNDPNNCCGDFISDTDAHTFGNIQLNNDCNNPNPNVSENIYRNYMSYVRPVRCQTQFTAIQGKRMRWYLVNAPLLQAMQIAPEVINTTTTWNTPQTKSANIEIESGATLTINATLTMMPGAYIIVKPGGTLIINSTITADCGMWGGVIVEGTGNQPQKELNGQYSTAQGRVVLNQAGTIEHAVRGVGVHGFVANDDDFGGGIAELKGKIRNCTYGVRFERYRRDSLPNVGYLAGLQIILNDEYRGINQPQPVMVHLKDVNRVSITLSWFYDLRTQGCEKRELRANGLVADDAAFRVSSTHFSNLDNGIIASPTEAGGYGSYEVLNSTFLNCFTEIYSSLPDPFTIRNNYFEVGRPTQCPLEATSGILRGVHLSGYPLAANTVISDNTFAAGNSDEEEILLGTDCFATGTAENFIRKNEFRGLTYGNRAAANNGGATGLRYECNESIGNLVADYYVPAFGSVRSVQGDVNAFGAPIAAGNIFSGALSWWNDGAPITYFYLDVPEQNPNTIGFVGAIDDEESTIPNPNCGSGGEGCLPPCEATVVNGWKSQFFQQKTSWQAKKALLPTLSGSTAEALAKEIAAHRSAMDIEGGKIIRNYALDSTGVKTDSVLTWTSHLQTYEADLRLARHYFFSRDFSTYYQWLDDIPTRNELTVAQSNELADFTQMLATVRPSLQAGVRLEQLPITVLDGLETWASDCNEPGFIAKEILRRNGRRAISECDGASEERQQPLRQLKSPAPNEIRFYPNPAGDYVFLEVPDQDLPLKVVVTNLDGRIVFQKILLSSDQIDVSGLSSGFYLCRFTTRSDININHKLIISR